MEPVPDRILQTHWIFISLLTPCVFVATGLLSYFHAFWALPLALVSAFVGALVVLYRVTLVGMRKATLLPDGQLQLPGGAVARDVSLSPIRRATASAYLVMVVFGALFALSGSTELLIIGMSICAAMIGPKLIRHDWGGPVALAAAPAEAPTVAASVPLPALPPGSEARLAALSERIHAAVATRGLTPVMGEALGQIDRLIEAHHQLTADMQGYASHLAEHPVSGVAAEIARCEEQLARAEEPTRALFAQNLELLRMRQTKLEASSSAREVALAQQGVIENTLKLILDQVLAATSTDDLADVLGRAAASVRATEETLAATRGLLPRAMEMRAS